MALYECIMSNHETMNRFSNYYGIWGTWALFWGIKRVQKGVKMLIIDIYSLLMEFSLTSLIKNITYNQNNIILVYFMENIHYWGN